MTEPFLGAPGAPREPFLGASGAPREPFLGASGAASEVSGTIVTLSAQALRFNARLARAAPDDTDHRAADAWGHGAAWVARVLAEEGLPGVEIGRLSGLDLYGLPGGSDGARPVMRMEGRVLSTKQLRAGEGVSYGYLFRAPTDTRVALVTGGYAQGVVRSLGGRASVLIRGERCPIVGRVAMDVCVVEIRTLPAARADAVVFFGDPARGEPSLGEWVDATAYTAPEIVTAVGLHARTVRA